MRRLAAILMLGAALGAGAADEYVFVQKGEVRSAPRGLPAVGVRLDTGEAVLGLHGRSDAERAACGWFRVLPSRSKAAKGKVVTGRTYTVLRDTVQEVLEFGERRIITPEQRVKAALQAMPGKTDDERVSALVRAVAVTVTGTLDRAVTITVPARRPQLDIREGTVR